MPSGCTCPSSARPTRNSRPPNRCGWAEIPAQVESSDSSSCKQFILKPRSHAVYQPQTAFMIPHTFACPRKTFDSQAPSRFRKSCSTGITLPPSACLFILSSANGADQAAEERCHNASASLSSFFGGESHTGKKNAAAAGCAATASTGWASHPRPVKACQSASRKVR